jgi:hypothetical protein
MGTILASLYYIVIGSINLIIFSIWTVGGIFMDSDHILNDIVKGRIKNPRKMIVNWFKSADIYTGEFHFLHNIEFLFIMLALSFFSKNLLYLFLSFTMHLATDYYMKVRHTNSFRIDDFSIILRTIEKRKSANNLQSSFQTLI